MVRDFKYIIKRILIGVGIALVLMFLKDGLILNVSAKGTALIPDKLRMNYTQNGTTTSTEYDIVTFNESTFPNVPWYGKTTTGNGITINQLRYHYNISSLNSGYYDINFLALNMSMNSSWYNGVVWSIHQAGNWYSCTPNYYSHADTSVGSAPTQPYVSGITCNNVYIDTTNPNFYILAHYSGTTNMSKEYGISSTTFLYNSTNNQQEVIDNQEEIIQQQQETNDLLKDETDPDTNDLFDNDNISDDSNSPVSDLITMPISLLQAINNNSNNSCSSWNLGSLLGTNITMPCINLSSILGSYLYNLIDMAICLFLAYNIGLLCITIYNNLTSLKDDFDDMYAPQHAYSPRHGGDN